MTDDVPMAGEGRRTGSGQRVAEGKGASSALTPGAEAENRIG